MKIAYSGIEGAFAHIAAKRIFPAEELISYGDFRSAYEAVEKGECDYAVLPIENSYAGEVGQVTDLMFQGGLFVNGVYTLNVMQNLLGVKGASVESVRKVISPRIHYRAGSEYSTSRKDGCRTRRHQCGRNCKRRDCSLVWT